MSEKPPQLDTIHKKLDRDPEKIPSFESYLERILPEQYRSQVQTLTRLGLLELLPNTESMGIHGIDGKEYPIPTITQIQEAMYANKELYETKLKQGFTSLQLTPFAVPLERLTMKLEEQLLKHHKEGKLFATKDPSETDEVSRGEPLALDTSQPLYVYDKWLDKNKAEGERGGDVLGGTIYYPKQFDKQNHGGYTKQELMDQSPNNAWNILLLEPNPNIPREGKGKTLGGNGSTGSPRRQLETNKSSIDYLKLLQTDPQYQNESGLTNEDWIIQFLNQLEKNQVIDDWQGKGSASFLIGQYNPSSVLVPSAYWDRGDQRAFLGRLGPGHSYGDRGCRSAVRVKT